MESELTETERHVLEHATGWRTRNPLFRNHYVAGPGHHSWNELQALRTRGLMRVSRAPDELTGGDYCYSVTEAGITLLKESDRKRKVPGGKSKRR